MDFNDLVQAIQTLNAEDAFRVRLNVDQWRAIAPYLTRHDIRAGDLLIKQGDTDRTMYLLGQGSLQVFVTGGPPRSNRIAILRAGSVGGGPGLFSDGPRMANVEAMTPSAAWAMPGPRLQEPAQPPPATPTACGARSPSLRPTPAPATGKVTLCSRAVCSSSTVSSSAPWK